MKNLKEKLLAIATNKVIWISLITIFVIITLTVAIVFVIAEYKKEITTNSKEALNVENTEEDDVNIETLTNTTNKTEEELKEINKKEVEEAKKKENKTTNTKNKYYIKVNYNAQVVNIYTYDKNGKYTVPVKAFVCSTGTETPRSGVYNIPAKITWCHMFGDVWAHYCSQIVGNILFHSVPYLEKNNHSLEYWAYDKLGTKASMGCIRLTTRDAKWIYDNVSVGTAVEFYSSSNPGPLGKPTTQKISNAPGNLKWWDPTDPDTSNPWRTYKPAVQNPTNNQQTNVQNANTTTQNVQNNVVQNEQQNTQINNVVINTQTTNNQTNNNEVQNNTQVNNQQENNVQNTQQTNNVEETNNTVENNTQTKPNEIANENNTEK